MTKRLWRIEGYKYNKAETERKLANGDIRKGQRIRHQGRRNKTDFGRSTYMNGVSPLLMALFNRVGLISKSQPQA